ncbi:MAG: 30S ribosomal protein S3 [Phycisphaeraceae bacterium]|jgi:small subunit ribosomal protein S3|nr:30S ribosomal protein S3 [Phycisphaeraceae bacterium]MDG1361421.1 30S ribosomal protein S3 [Phycisphaerales bacterium]NCF38654.1 30S ribosomal protein S3 [Planctomycetia bacterium]MCP4069807.1 30S ribosomal protein S3 [Phycisphaeraceae bacterium]MCP4796752.1 30S ribosomal protein S3 [Phycisphaeraceae bacterium]
MGQKTHPFGFRVGITETHKSRWFAPKALFGELLVEDYRIRKFVDKRLNRTPPFAAVSDIFLERTREELTVIIRTARPGQVVGQKGSEVESLTRDLQALTGRKVVIKIIEIKNPEIDATLIAETVSEQMKKRSNFRRALKQRCESAMQNGAKGIRIQVAGRLGGAEMSRRFDTRLGSIPLSTLQANVDYALAESRTTYGIIGVKVWVYKGMFGDHEDDNSVQTSAAGGRARARGRR